MKKIAFINQRYGLEVNGGSEYYTRLLAEHLKDIYDVEVLTTKALDHVTWGNYYKEDVETINGVCVRRFKVNKKRKMKKFAKHTCKLQNEEGHSLLEEKKWLVEQGPYCPELKDYIVQHQDEYDLFIFVTYLYYTTCECIREVWDKSVLIPTAHDEPYIYFDMYKDVFSRCRAIIYLTNEEKEFVEQLFCNQDRLNTVTAIGVDVPEFKHDVEMQKRIGSEHYMIYVGRIDEGKGCSMLFKYFLEYKKRNKNDLKLVLMGKASMEIPEHEDIVYLGFVTEEEKFSGVSEADALILPSHFESLSISVLEALKVGTPVIVNGDCEVLKGHCVKSNAGLYYTNFFEFEGCVNYMLKNSKTREQMMKNGKKYVETYYQWDVVLERLREIFERVSK